MSKICRLTTSTIIILGFLFSLGCDNKDQTKVSSLKDTKWILTQSIDLETQTVSNFPPEIKNFFVIFKEGGSLTIEDLCNFSYGTFSATDSSLNITHVGPGTEMFCISETFMLWESTLINGLKTAKDYSIDDNKLSITCDNKSNLIFQFEGEVK